MNSSESNAVEADPLSNALHLVADDFKVHALTCLNVAIKFNESRGFVDENKVADSSISMVQDIYDR